MKYYVVEHFEYAVGNLSGEEFKDLILDGFEKMEYGVRTDSGEELEFWMKFTG